MHRLIKLSGINLYRFPRVSLTSVENVGYNENDKTCSLCKKINIDFKTSWRPYTTHVNPNQPTKKMKKRKKSRRNYVELLIVSEKSATEQRASVTKLTSSDLKLLATTNLNLSELYKLKKLAKDLRHVEEHTYNNLSVIDNLPTVNYSTEVSDIFNSNDSDIKNVINCEIPPVSSSTNEPSSSLHNSNAVYSVNLPEKLLLSEEEHLEAKVLSGKAEFVSEVENQETDVLDSIPHALHPAVLEEHPEVTEAIEEEVKEKPNKQADYDAQMREEIELKTLASYMEVCSALKLPHRGLASLYFHTTSMKRVNSRKYVPITKIEIYNILMKGFAAKGNLKKLYEVIDLARSQNVELDLHSYLAIFECLGHAKSHDDYSSLINKHAQEALRKGITFDKMMNEGYFLNDERQLVLKAMNVFDRNYIPKFEKPCTQYNNHLVNQLNCVEQLKPPKQNKFVENGGLFTPKLLQDAVEKQVELEKISYVTVKSIESKSEPTEEILKYRETLNQHYQMWEDVATKAFRRDLMALTAQKSNKCNYEAYMRSIPVKEFITIIVDEARRLAQGSETYSPTVKQLHRELGSRVYSRYLILRKQNMGVLDKISKIHIKYCNDYAASHPELGVLPSQGDLLNHRQKWQWAEHYCKPHGATVSMNHQEWVPPVLQFVGKFLYHIIINDLKIDTSCLRQNNKHKNFLPAFYTIFRTQARLVKEEVKPHPILSKLYRSAMPETLTFPACELPMLCPPVPWVSVNQGGYLVVPSDVVRLPMNASAQKDRMTGIPPEQNYPALDALNQLAAVPWRVNRKILDIILKLFTSGGCKSLDIPEHPSSLPPPVPPSSDMDKSERYQLFRQKLQHLRKKAEMYSLWCDCLYRLSLANHFKDDTFWLPHNMDFRGRVYPIPPHLNHLGSDLARSLLVFAESRPLGSKGLDWLKIHLINLTGLKKRDPVSERLRFANANMDYILDSADKPLTGRRWWAESEEPWQTLACCMEIADAVRSDDPENFRSHFPIHQDGSCNGLQHYAALGRDSAGAHSVNLTPSVQPQDVYSAVVNLVEQQRVKDANNGLEIAKLLEGFVKRKVIKQTIMTTVYGVTRFGARLQIARQLKDIDGFPKQSVWAASSYLTTKTFESLRSMFTSTREIQDWFTECARLISAVSGHHVEWVTPLGLPIVQPYIRPRKIKHSKLYDSYSINKFEKPNVMKQKNAFAPNFVHSLDSCHMMLTSLYSERAGITFVSVHDCYWTHASTVHIMNKICREQFVALHSEPILENLSVFFSEKYSYDDTDFADDGSVLDLTKKKLNRILRKLPKKGEFNIDEVLDSVYFFS